MGRASACLLEGAATTLVLVSLVIEIVCVAKERSRAGDGEVSIHVYINTENHSVLGVLVARIGFNIFLHDDGR